MLCLISNKHYLDHIKNIHETYSDPIAENGRHKLHCTELSSLGKRLRQIFDVLCLRAAVPAASTGAIVRLSALKLSKLTAALRLLT
jgi:hypothetical protein